MNATGPTPGGSWDDLLSALEFVVRRFEGWREEKRIRKDQADAIAAYYQQQGEAWRQAVQAGKPSPEVTELPLGTAAASPPVRVFHFWKFLRREIHQHHLAGRLALPQYHALMQEAEERLAALERRVQQEGMDLYRLKEEAPVFVGKIREEKEPEPPRRTLLEMMLDPRSIQWLLGSGGALMVVGLVILLWVNEFLTPPVMAVTLGIANAAVLVGGWGLILKTRYQFTGKAITLLACLVMPLNLWYYHANDLITIDGHLWMVGAVISVLYALSAYLLKDDLFVYVLMGGVTLTGLLILADWPPSPEKFWEIASPATLLVALGLIAIHLERAFPDEEGPFNRKRFGMAFFWSGHAVLAAGLLLVLGAQVAGDWLYQPVFKDIYAKLQAKPSPLVHDPELQLLALALVLIGTYAYIYSDLVVRKVGVYVYVAAGTLLWALVLGLRLLQIELGTEVLIVLCAGLALVVNGVQALWPQGVKGIRTFPIFGALLCSVAVLLGLRVYEQAVMPTLRAVDVFEWKYVGAMLAAALSCRAGAHLYRHSWPKLSAYYFFGTAAATLVGAVALLTTFGLTQWEQQAPWLMLIPIAYLVAAKLYRGHAAHKPMLWCAHLATVVMIVSSLSVSVESLANLTRVIEGKQLNLILALFFAEVTVFYALSAVFFQHRGDIHLATAAVCAALWQLLTFAGVQGEYYTLVFALAGLGLLLAYRFAAVERMAKTAYQSGNTLLTVSFAAAILLGLSRLVGPIIHWEFVGLCVTLGLLSLVAVALVQRSGWRRWYVVSAVAQAFLTFWALQKLSTLSPLQKLEIFSVVSGLVLLALGHLGWYRERERHNDMVTLALLFGSLLAALPLAIATLVDRSRGDFLWANEVGFLVVSVLLLVTGLVFQLKATTIVGAFHTAMYFLTLLIFVPWGQINTVAIIITVGGSVLFGTGLLLSVYRERLLTLPDRIKVMVHRPVAELKEHLVTI